MPDSEIPDRFGPAIKWAVAVIFLGGFFLLAGESFKDGHWGIGFIYSALFVLSFMIAVKWEQITAYLQRDKVATVLIIIGLICAVGLGLVIGALISRGVSPPEQAQSTGRIAWNFDQTARGEGYFLNMGKLNDGEIHVAGFGAHGKNTSKDPITEFKGYIRSDLTNAQLPIYIIAFGPDHQARPGEISFPNMFPTLPEETYGIPGLAEFDIVTHKTQAIQSGVDGMPLSKFLREFGAFTLVLEYDGIKLEKQFTADSIKKQLELFDKSLNPQNATIPRVTRKPNATPPPEPIIMPLPFPMQPQQKAPDQH